MMAETEVIFWKHFRKSTVQKIVSMHFVVCWPRKNRDYKIYFATASKHLGRRNWNTLGIRRFQSATLVYPEIYFPEIGPIFNKTILFVNFVWGGHQHTTKCIQTNFGTVDLRKCFQKITSERRMSERIELIGDNERVHQ